MFFRKKSNNKKKKDDEENNQPDISKEAYSEAVLAEMQLSTSLAHNAEMVKKVVGGNFDLVSRYFTLGRIETVHAAVFYFDNMLDPKQVDSNIMQPMIVGSYSSGLVKGTEIVSEICSGNIITRTEIKTARNMKELTDGILEGDVVLLIDGTAESHVISVKGYNYRNIKESEVEPTVKGTRDSFVEVLNVNIGLIRRRIKSPNLIFEPMKIGRVTQTNICISYIRGICPPNLIDEVRSRIEKIDIDGVLGSNYIEEFIVDEPFSIFPQIRNTERPDVASAALLEGRAVIFVDNTPVTLIVPGELFSLLQSSEDYFNGYIFSSVLRILRFIALAIALTLPSFYIAIVNFHQELIPTRLLVSITSARTGVPFPNFAEALLMEATFEILREAGVRLPRPVGPAVSIVGGLVIGQAAVQASIVSPLMVIVVSLTAISAFTIPQYNISLSIRLIRFVLMMLSAILGLYGMMLGILFLLLHLCSIRSFGTPYLAPLAPFNLNDNKDTFIRAPLWMFKNRPSHTSYNRKRMSSDQMPEPPEGE